jgi:hypothetical protein
LIYADTGVHHPAFLKKPALRSDCVKYLDAFRSLSASRMWSQAGPSPIQVSEVKALLDLTDEESPDERSRFLALMQELDRVEMRHLYEKSKK